MTETMWRYVSRQGDDRFVSEALYTKEEVAEILEIEAILHRGTGWRVFVSHNPPALVCEHEGVRRVISFEEE
ncbi:MAG: hypothetical protein KatS3mg015_2480 [Fimbriimonadales bacterium]|nr:MAG: hypothetical protein KatS3mg015_2480 [Fimbriimonadales bacterium]